MIKVKAEDIKKEFPNKSGRAMSVALGGINLEIRDGEFFAIVGPSGCGKSTFLEIVAGLIRPTSGSIYIDGFRISGPDHNRGIVFQGYALFPWRTVIGLSGFENHYPHELSGGMKQRVAIARALAYDPDILLMDEPFAALDARTREILQDEVLRIWNKTKKTVLFVTHNIEKAVFLADRIAIMSGRPGVIKKIIDVPLSRPRQEEHRLTQDFMRLRYDVGILVMSHQEAGSGYCLLIMI